MPRRLFAIALLTVLPLAAPAEAQLPFEGLTKSLELFCGRVAKMDEETLNTSEKEIATFIASLNFPDDRSPLNYLRRRLSDIQKEIAGQQREIRDIEAKIVDARKAAQGATSLDTEIRSWEGTLGQLQTKRLALHAGAGGQPGIDALEQQIAEIDRRTATNGYVSGAERTAALAERAALDTKCGTLLAEKSNLAGEFRAAQMELDRLRAERDRFNPQVEKLRRLERELEVANKSLADLRKTQKGLQKESDYYREVASELLLNGDQFRACIAERRKALAAAQPQDPAKPPSATAATFTLSGSWAGKCKAFDATAGGKFTLTAAAGRISGSFSGDSSGAISGSVNGTGQLVAAGGGGSGKGTVQWRGTISQAGGRWSGAGSWSSDGGACSGSWQSQ